MGCSASRPTTFLTTPTTEEPSSSSTSHSSHSSSFSHSFSKTLSLSTPLVHHPPLKKGDTHHLVSLTSTTYGSLVLISNKPTSPNPDFNGLDHPSSPPHITDSKNLTDSKEVSSPDSVINTWELMDGLDDFDVNTNSFIFEPPIESPKKPNSYLCSGCDGSVKKLHDSFESSMKSSKLVDGSTQKLCSSHESVKSSKLVDGSAQKLFNLHESVKSSKLVDGSVQRLLDSNESVKSSKLVEDSSVTKPLWKHLSEESLLSKMDPNVALSYRQALSSRQLGYNNQPMKTTVKTLACTSPLKKSSQYSNSQVLLEGAEDRIVLYFTSLRGIRKTYEDCCAVQMIFRGFRVAVDEKDISMDSSYRKELQSALGGKALSLPQVFIRGKYVGGADEIKQLHEVGELGKLLEGFPIRDPGFVCKSCGDARFVPCGNCNGSRKVFEEEERQLSRCPECNENGLIRCPICCSS